MSKQRSSKTNADARKTPAATLESKSSTIRIAIDSSGRPGSLYDGWHDRILQPVNTNFTIKSSAPQKSTICCVQKCVLDKPSNLLKMINMHQELRLSIASEMIPAKGVGALFNYSHPIDKYTRLMCYSCFSRTESLTNDEFKSQNKHTLKISETRATHFIFEVNWGVDACAVLQLPSDDQLAVAIDHTLKILCDRLQCDHTNSALTKNEKDLLEHIAPIEVFSNIPDLADIKSITDFYRAIPRLENDGKLHKPYNYILCPIEDFYPSINEKKVIFKELNEDYIINIECYLLQLLLQFKTLKAVNEKDLPNLQRHLTNQLREKHSQRSNIEEKYKREVEQIRDLVTGIRKGQIEENSVYQVITSDNKDELAQCIEKFNKSLDDMKLKERFIGDLIQQQFEYRNAVDCDVKNSDNDQTLERKLTNNMHEGIICSDDRLYKINTSQWLRIRDQLIQEREKVPQLRFIYVDFAYCSYNLTDFKILRIRDENKTAGVPKSATQSLGVPSLKDNTINILLLGESGVGKSTFINALVNYLNFDTFKKAQSKKPIVLIPGSFIMTINDSFDEQVVTFGELDSLSNEDYDHTGGSVTQHCKSYVFTFGNGTNIGRKLRIIDTPGIGDVRGVDQDDMNMQHVLSYINNLPHLNAVCILMKPNNDRLNISFHSSFTQLFDFLGEDASAHFIFCFTNARSTFYTPGNTGPQLKQLLKSLPVQEVPFKKENTFCFDSESFRYLVALNDGIKFEENQKQEYEDSWKKSSTESQRYLQHICTHMTPLPVSGERESIKQAQITIGYMIRPMLEAMRNILRNIVLWNAKSRNVSIELRPKIIKSATAVCFACPREPQRCGDFWITPDGLHFFLNKCRTCSCSPNKHISINYELEHKLCNQPSKDSDGEMTDMLDNLCQASAEFAEFLLEAVQSSESDPFLSGLKRMIKEEDDIRAKKSPCPLNSSLFEQLHQLKTNYEGIRKKMATKKDHSKLSEVYATIEKVSEYRMIELQLAAVKQWQKFMIKFHECEVLI